MALTEIDIVNMALSAGLGHTILFTSSGGTVATITAPTSGKYYEQVVTHFARCRGRMEEYFHWPRFTKFVRCALTDTIESTDPETTEYAYFYAYPTAALVRRIVTGGGPDDPNAVRYIIGQHGGALGLLTDQRFTDVTGDFINVEINDASTNATYFNETFAWALAWCLADAMAKGWGKDDAERASIKQDFAAALATGERVALAEQYRRDDGGGPYVTARGGG